MVKQQNQPNIKNKFVDKTFILLLFFMPTYTGTLFFLIDSLSLHTYEFVIYNAFIFATILLIYKRLAHIAYIPSKTFHTLKRKFDINGKFEFYDEVTKFYYITFGILFLISLFILYYLRYVILFSDLIIHETQLFYLAKLLLVSVLFANFAIFPLIKIYFNTKKLKTQFHKSILVVFISNLILQILLIIVTVISFVCALIILAVFVAAGVGFG